MEIIYVDSLFILNLIIDYLLLVISFRLCSLPIRRLRCLMGALAGGAYAVMCYLPGFGFLETAPCKIALWLILSLIAFGGEEYLFKCALSFLTVSAVFGGGVWAAAMLIGNGVYEAPRLNLGMLIFSFAVCYAFLSLTLSCKMRVQGGELVTVKIVLRGKAACVTALRDSGNCLREQLSGKRVLAVGASSVAELFTPSELDALRMSDGSKALLALGSIPDSPRFRPVIYSALGVSAALIPAFSADELWINGERNRDYVVAVSPFSVGSGEFCAVI